MSKSIRQLEIKNFQSHKHTVLEFDEGINLFTGTSNSGKSAINRAIIWAMTNRPRGEDFIHNNTSFASVSIVFFDGSKLLKVRGIEENFVKVTYPDGKWKKYEKFGAEYPDDLKKFLSIPKDNDILGNVFYAEQMSPLFLVNLSSTDLPRAIGYLAGSDVMELAGKNMQQESRQIRRDTDKLKKEIDKLSKELKQYDNLEEQILLIDQCKLLKQNLKSKIDFKNLIENLYTSYEIKNKNIISAKAKLSEFKNTEALIDNISNIKQLIRSYQDFNKFLSKYEQLNQNISEVQSGISNLENLHISELTLSNLTTLKSNIQNTQSMSVLLSKYNAHKDTVLSTDAQIKLLDKNSNTNAKKADKLKKTLLEAGYICNACGQKISK